MTRAAAVSASGGRYARIVKAVCSGGAARILSSLVSLLTLPLAVRYLGPERYGVWATVTTTAVWINLLDLGIANTLTNQISRAYALERQGGGAATLHECPRSHGFRDHVCRRGIRLAVPTRELGPIA